MRSFGTYIKSILKQLSGETRISARALSEIDTLSDRLTTAVALGVRRQLVANPKIVTISNEKVLTAYKLFAPDNIFGLANELAKKALITYEQSEDSHSRLEAKAGLTVSASLCRKYLMSFSPKNARMSRTAPIVLAAIVEAFLTEMLNPLSNSARDHKRATILPRDLVLAIQNDSDFLALTHAILYEQRSGGVVPNISSALISSDKKYKKAKRPSQAQLGHVPAPHRFHPGTVSLRRIRRYQKTAETVVSNTTSRRIIKAALSDGMRLSKQAHELLHELMESEGVSILQDAVNLTVHAGRIVTKGEDVVLAVRLRWKGLEELLPSSSEELKKPELARLGYRAGIKTRSETFYAETNKYVSRFLTNIVQKSALAAEAAGRKTLMPEDVGLALDALNVPRGGL